MRIAEVAIVGAGTAHVPDGSTLAVACGRAGFRTVLEDILPGNLRSARARISDVDAAYMPRTAAGIEDAVRNADLVLDTVPDELESKLEILSLLDRMAPPRTLFLTPTRALSIADLAACTYRPGQCFALAFLDLMEMPGWRAALVAPPAAVPEDIARVRAFLERLGARVSTRIDTAV